MSGTTTAGAKSEAELVIRGQHTPTPWRYVPWHIEEGPSAVRAPAGYLVCTTASDADASLIARAVNAHNDLVKALKNAQRALAMVVAPEAIKTTSVMGAYAHAFEAEVAARAALSKAGAA